MTRPTALDLAELDPLPDEIRRYFEICQEKLGLVPNVLRAYAFDAAKFGAFSGFYNELMLGESGLSELEREMIAVAVSAENRCFYCLVAHGAALRVLSGDPGLGEMIAMNYRVAPLDARQRAMLDFAVLVTKASATIGEADRQALRAVPAFRERGHLATSAAVASFFNMSNRMASAVAMAPNPDYHAQAR